MRKLFLISILFSLIFGSEAFTRATYVNNKEICETNKGNWRIFNNQCANNCENKFDSLLCVSTSSFACDCGVGRCWNGDKCIPIKIAKIDFDKKTQEAKKRRAAELKELEEKTIAFNQAYQNYIQNQVQTSGQETKIDTPISSNQATTEAIPVQITDPEIIKKNEEQKQICEKQNGTWQEFKNGCVDNCGSKIAKISMCTMSITMGCKCGESKCWDGAKNACIEIEEYKKSTKPITTLDVKPATPISDLPNSNIDSKKQIEQSLNK